MLNQVEHTGGNLPTAQLLSRLAELEDHIAELRDRADRDAMNIATLQTALETARQIGAAVGIVMTTLKVTQQAALDLLVVASQTATASCGTSPPTWSRPDTYLSASH